MGLAAGGLAGGAGGLFTYTGKYQHQCQSATNQTKELGLLSYLSNILSPHWPKSGGVKKIFFARFARKIVPPHFQNVAPPLRHYTRIIFASIMAFRERSGTPHNRGSFAGSQPCSANNDTLFYGGLRSSDLGGLYPSCVICCAVSNSSCTRRNTCATCTARRQRSVSEWAEFNVQLDYRSLTVICLRAINGADVLLRSAVVADGETNHARWTVDPSLKYADHHRTAYTAKHGKTAVSWNSVPVVLRQITRYNLFQNQTG